MMELNGKTFYRITDAEKEFGYTKGTLVNYISGGIVDAERMDDGEWLITETGWVQLRRRKGGNVNVGGTSNQNKPPTPQLITMDAPTPEVKPDHFVDANKMISKEPKPEKRPHKPAGFGEGVVYMRTEEDRQIYGALRQAGVKLGKTTGDMCMIAVRYYMKDILSPNLKKIEALEDERQKLLQGITTS